MLQQKKRLLDEEAQNDHVAPFFSMCDHTLPVTDIICGIGIFPDCRVLTSSIDHSVKVLYIFNLHDGILSNQHLSQLWDLSSRSLLTTFHFPQPISYLAWDVTERLFFAASADGSIHQMNLFREQTSKLGGIITEAVGGAGVTDVIRVDDDESREASKKRLISVGYPFFRQKHWTLFYLTFLFFFPLENHYRVYASR